MEYKTIFKYRKFIMGFAMLLLVLHHGRAYVPAGRVNDLVALLYGGVDFFLFCSGIGCFFSYVSDRNPAAFLARRARRIYPVYLVFMAYWLYSPLTKGSIALRDVLGNLLWVQWLTGREPVFNWYMSALLLTYLLTPVLASLAEWADTPPRALGALLGLVVLSLCFWHTDQWVIITTRIPLFFTGMLFAAASRRREKLSRAELILLALVTLAGGVFLRLVHIDASEARLWDCGMYWYPFLLIIPGASVGLAFAAQFLERCAPGRWLVTAIAFVGGYTFEIFITHCYALRGSVWHYLLFAAIYAAVLHLASLAVKKAGELIGRLLRPARESAS